jgi:hypothetical protein
VVVLPDRSRSPAEPGRLARAGRRKGRARALRELRDSRAFTRRVGAFRSSDGERKGKVGEGGGGLYAGTG